VVGLFVFYQLIVVSKGIRGLPERRRGRRDPLFDVPNFHDMFEGVKDTRTRLGYSSSTRSVKKESSMSDHR
jgi:hypothetical protein